MSSLRQATSLAQGASLQRKQSNSCFIYQVNCPASHRDYLDIVQESETISGTVLGFKRTYNVIEETGYMCTSLRQSTVNSLLEVLGCGRKELVRKLGDLVLAMLCCWLSYLETIFSLFCAYTKRTEQENIKKQTKD